MQGREEECKDDEKNEDVLFTPEQTIDEMEEDSVQQSESWNGPGMTLVSSIVTNYTFQ